MKLRMVDRITAWEPFARIAGSKVVSFEEYCLYEPFGGPARLPESLLLESFLQLGNWLILLSTNFAEMGFIARLGRIEFSELVLPGERLDMDVRVDSRREDGWLLSGVGTAGGRGVIRGEACLATLVPAAEYVDASDIRVLFSEICAAEPA